MTNQIPDLCVHREQVFDLIASSEPGPLPSAVRDLALEAPHSALWRGYQARYRITEAQLELAELTVHISGGPAPALFGGAAELDPGCPGRFSYAPSGAKLSYSGGLLVGAELDPEAVESCSPPAPWCFDQLRELVFHDGRMIAEHDRSSQARARRLELARDPEASPAPGLDASVCDYGPIWL
jgi:hypothetical protein